MANDITSVSQAKRFYPLFAVTGNLAPILSGKVMQHIVSQQQKNSQNANIVNGVGVAVGNGNVDGSNGFGGTLKKLAIVKMMSGVAILILYNLIYRGVDRNRDVDQKQDNKGYNNAKNGNAKIPSKNNAPSHKSKKESSSLSESIEELSKSPQLKSMAFMVLGYNVCVELTEVLWKGILRKTHPTEAAYMTYMARFSQKVGYVALILQLSASFIIKKLGWTRASRLTPIAMLGLAIPFFASVVLSNSKRYSDAIPLTLALTIGTYQNVINKVAKYSLFDPLKEMAYIPLPPDAKTKGKAAIDVLGARLGRSIAAGWQQVLVLFLGGTSGSSGNILECGLWLAGVYFGMIGVWLRAVGVLGSMFDDQESTGTRSNRGEGKEDGRNHEEKDI